MKLIIGFVCFSIGAVVSLLIFASLTLVAREEFTPMIVLYSATTLIALSAMFLTIWQIKATHTHNKLSVKPKLSITKFAEGPKRNLSYKISNLGLGPAIIENYQVLLDDVNRELASPEHAIEFSRILMGDLPGIKSSVYTVTPGAILQPGQSFKILDISWDEDEDGLSPTTSSIWRRVHERLSINISYTTLYEELITYQKSV